MPSEAMPSQAMPSQPSLKACFNKQHLKRAKTFLKEQPRDDDLESVADDHGGSTVAGDDLSTVVGDDLETLADEADTAEELAAAVAASLETDEPSGTEEAAKAAGTPGAEKVAEAAGTSGAEKVAEAAEAAEAGETAASLPKAGEAGAAETA
jgi:hypothetical protein